MNGPEEMGVNAAFRRIRALDRTLLDRTVNKEERATLLIRECIKEGFSTGMRITGVLAKIGHNKRYVGMRLKAGLQQNPVYPYWGKRDDGTYFVPEPVLPEI